MRAALVALAGFLIAAGPAFAQVESKVSTEFQKKLEDDYGVRESPILTEALTKKVERTFAAKGLKPARVLLTIEDARPNRPTFHQISDKPGLDPMRSISTGGARITGVAYDASGKELASLDYDWYETDITNAIGSTTWTDARWVFDRFADRFAKKLGAVQAADKSSSIAGDDQLAAIEPATLTR